MRLLSIVTEEGPTQMLSNTTILLVRHGEKPGDPGSDNKSDGPGLSPAGQARAQAYVEYFADFTASSADGSRSTKVELEWVFATADNPGTSYRPRLDGTRLDDRRTDVMGGDSGETAVGKPSR